MKPFFWPATGLLLTNQNTPVYLLSQWKSSTSSTVCTPFFYRFFSCGLGLFDLFTVLSLVARSGDVSFVATVLVRALTCVSFHPMDVCVLSHRRHRPLNTNKPRKPGKKGSINAANQPMKRKARTQHVHKAQTPQAVRHSNNSTLVHSKSLRQLLFDCSISGRLAGVVYTA